MTYDEWTKMVRELVLARMTDWGRADETDSCFNNPEGDRRDYEKGIPAEKAAEYKLDAYDEWLNYGQYL